MTKKDWFWLKIALVQKMIPLLIIIIGGCISEQGAITPQWLIIWYTISGIVFLLVFIYFMWKRIEEDRKRLKELFKEIRERKK